MSPCTKKKKTTHFQYTLAPSRHSPSRNEDSGIAERIGPKRENHQILQFQVLS